jgi:hypothetical protein
VIVNFGVATEIVPTAGVALTVLPAASGLAAVALIVLVPLLPSVRVTAVITQSAIQDAPWASVEIRYAVALVLPIVTSTPFTLQLKDPPVVNGFQTSILAKLTGWLVVFLTASVRFAFPEAGMD